MLYRALGHIRGGFYVDVGAHDPEELSVTKAFYDRGWSGINIEPSSERFRKLCLHRPRDTNLQLLVAEQQGSRDFFEVGTTGLSTMDGELAESYRSQGYGVDVKAMSVSTLDDLLDGHAAREIHFLKVDVEGAEEEVLKGIEEWHWPVIRQAVFEVHRGTESRDAMEARLRGHGFQTTAEQLMEGVHHLHVVHTWRE